MNNSREDIKLNMYNVLLLKIISGKLGETFIQK